MLTMSYEIVFKEDNSWLRLSTLNLGRRGSAGPRILCTLHSNAPVPIFTASRLT
jgi:hypothetical protein